MQLNYHLEFPFPVTFINVDLNSEPLFFSLKKLLRYLYKLGFLATHSLHFYLSGNDLLCHFFPVCTVFFTQMLF